MPKNLQLIVTCEHGGNVVPERYVRLFQGVEEILGSHRGYDAGALELAETLSRELSVPFYASTVTRLLVDCNRSLRNRRSLFSEFTRRLNAAERTTILEDAYLPHRTTVEAAVAKHVQRGQRVLHLAVHTFTPVFHGKVRMADAALLYDPTRPLETRFCRAWQRALSDSASGLRVRRNYPYRGTADGFPSYLRHLFPGTVYLGIELEVSQKYPLGGGAAWHRLQYVIAGTLDTAIKNFSGEKPTSGTPEEQRLS